MAPLPKGGWHGEAVTGGFFHARTRGKCAAVYPARYPSTSLRLVPLPLGKGGNAFWGGAMGRVVREADPYALFTDRTS